MPLMHQKHCYDIHHNLAIDYENGHPQIGPCCQSGRVPVQETKIDLLWKNPVLQRLRGENHQGLLDQKICESCIRPESAGLTSRRIDTQQFYQSWQPTGPGLRSLDLKLSNLCNLRCSICGPGASTAWAVDARRLGIEMPEKYSYDRVYNQTLQLEIPDASMIQDLEMVKFWGGEPLINEDHARVLETLDGHGVLQNCRIIYNTNGTQRVTQRVLDLWSRARLVEIYFSIDDIGDRFEHQRYGASWKEVTDNLEWYHENLPSNHLFYVMTTVSWYNLLYLPELLAWKNQCFAHNRFGDPVRLCLQPAVGRCSITTIGQHMQQTLADKFHDVPELGNWLNLYQAVPGYQPREFIDWAQRLDSVRGTNWRKTFPELASMIDDRIS